MFITLVSFLVPHLSNTPDLTPGSHWSDEYSPAFSHLILTAVLWCKCGDCCHCTHEGPALFSKKFSLNRTAGKWQSSNLNHNPKAQTLNGRRNNMSEKKKEIAGHVWSIVSSLTIGKGMGGKVKGSLARRLWFSADLFSTQRRGCVCTSNLHDSWAYRLNVSSKWCSHVKECPI